MKASARSAPIHRWLTCVAVTVFGSASGIARTADGGCKPVVDAMLRLPTLPYHSFTTLQIPGAGKVSSETINDGKKIYILHNGKWKISPLTAQDLLAQEKQNVQTNRTACTVVRDETIDGVSATLYSTQEMNDDGTTNSQVWLSKSTGLPVHTKIETSAAETRYEYSNVSAPPID